jgi:CheY-like chemotaxis protein
MNAPLRIMIVDDQREVCRLLQSALVTLEHELVILEMPSGEEAFLYASNNSVDLLVADYRLPGISGIQLMRKIRNIHPATKVILITGLSDPKVRKEVALAGADAFFIKPISIADFLDSVERVLGLVETILPLEPIQNETLVKEQQGLAELISGVRQKMDAQAVLLFNDRGRVLACAGELPENSQEAVLVDLLMSIYNAGKKVSQLVGHAVNSSWHVFGGGMFDLIFAPIDSTHALLMAGENLAGENVVLENLRHFSGSRQAIEASLNLLDGPTIPYIKEMPIESETDHASEIVSADLEPLLKKTKPDVKKDELDAYWSEGTDAQPSVPMNADGISYDQARQLGLTPADDQV